jgi:hypothetical protein
VVWSQEQIDNAVAVVQVATQRQLGDQGAILGVMVAITESTLHNVNHGDGPGPSSRGLFQQMPSWGPISVRMDPAGAAGLFYDALAGLAGWTTLAPWVAAQRVQRSEFHAGFHGDGSDGTEGWNYRQNLPAATSLVSLLKTFRPPVAQSEECAMTVDELLVLLRDPEVTQFLRDCMWHARDSVGEPIVNVVQRIDVSLQSLLARPA